MSRKHVLFESILFPSIHIIIHNIAVIKDGDIYICSYALYTAINYLRDEINLYTVVHNILLISIRNELK